MTQISGAEDSVDADTLAKVQKVLKEFKSTGSVNVLFANPVLLSPRWLKYLRKVDETPKGRRGSACWRERRMICASNPGHLATGRSTSFF